MYIYKNILYIKCKFPLSQIRLSKRKVKYDSSVSVTPDHNALRHTDVIVTTAHMSLILKWQSKYQLVNTLKSLNWIQIVLKQETNSSKETGPPVAAN